MKSDTSSCQEYINNLDEERKLAITQLRKVIIDNLPNGFEETMSYGMLGFVVPHSLYPNGYHCDPTLPLPFINLASNKNFIAVHHMGIYSDNNLLEWFKNQYPDHCKYKLDMGKSCIRFKKMSDIPYELIGKLAAKMTVKDWIEQYEQSISE